MVDCSFLFVETSPLLHPMTVLLPSSETILYHPHTDIARAVAAADDAMAFTLRTKDTFSCRITDHALIVWETGYAVAVAMITA